MIPVSPRPISAEELAVLRAALERCAVPPAFDGVRASLDALTVVSRCECGCASVDFVEDDGRRPHPLADGTAKTPSGGDVGIIVWGHPHCVTALEIYDLGAAEDGQVLPVPESIMPW